MIDLLNRIGFKQIAFGGGGGGGGGGGNNDNDDYGYDPYEDADLYDDNGYQTEYSDPNYGYDDNDNDGPSAAEKAATAKALADAKAAADLAAANAAREQGRS
jgi:hypothetical protein